MLLKKFRVKNYKSIIDSGDCYLTENVTILAGKNESGKTSILEALEDFDSNKDIRQSAQPIQNKEAISEISITFVVEVELIKEIFKNISINIELTESIEVELIKVFPNHYSISEKTKKDLGLNFKTKETKIYENIEKKLDVLSEIHQRYPQLNVAIPQSNFEDLQAFKNLVIQFRDQINPNFALITDEHDSEVFSLSLADIIDHVDELLILLNAEKGFVEGIKEYIPNFILFNSFEDIFPNKIPFVELDKNEWIKDLSIVSDLDIETIKGTDDSSKEKHRDDVNVKLNKDYEKFWTQDISNLTVNWDSANLLFWIKEDGYPYKPSLRSKGRQWHLAFYIKVSARALENVPNIILIDEPGLFLHAQAQKDILKKLEDSSNETQLIFSTHSPYLLEAEKLNRIRLIHRTKDDGTKIENKVHALADKETLTPILTAIGLELNSGITHLDKLNNVVVEGGSDLFYLEAFKKIIGKDELHFVFGGGAGNMPFVGTILHGWGCKVVYLYDNDQGKKDGEKNLKDNWLIKQDLILSVIDKKGSIEDIFSPKDFKKYVLNDETIEYKGSNSDYIKKSSKHGDKVLLARLFLQKVEGDKSLKFETSTETNVKKLFEKLNEKLKE